MSCISIAIVGVGGVVLPPAMAQEVSEELSGDAIDQILLLPIVTEEDPSNAEGEDFGGERIEEVNPEGTNPTETEQHREQSEIFQLLQLDFSRLPPPSSSPGPFPIPLGRLPLIPDVETEVWLESQLEDRLMVINDRIVRRQTMLQELLATPNSTDDRIRQVQSILSQIRTDRDRIALEHLLLLRQLSEDGTLSNLENAETTDSEIRGEGLKPEPDTSQDPS